MHAEMSSPDQPGSNSLVAAAHWKFDESSGNTATDSAGGFPAHLSPSGAQFIANGVSGRAIHLDRVSGGYAEVGDILDLESGGFTCSVWIRMSAGDLSGPAVILSKHVPGFPNGYYLAANHDAPFGQLGRASFFAGNTDHVPATTSTTIVNDGQWHHVVGVYNRNEQTLIFVDGVPAEDSRSTLPPRAQPGSFVIGGTFPTVPESLFTGDIDDVQIYRRALSDSEIDQLFQNPGSNLAELATRILFNPPAGNFVGSTEVALTSTVVGTTIRYTVDTSEPMADSPSFLNPLVIVDTTTVRARLFVNEFPVSEIISATYTKVLPIMFDPTGGLFTNSVRVAITNSLGLGIVRFTIDGSEPTATSPTYAQPLTITNAATVKARIFVDGFPASATFSASYTRIYALADGIPNEWREQYFGPGYLTDPRVPAEADPDHDGWSNLLEFQGNTNPMDPNSRPAIVADIRAIPSISWNSIPGKIYRVLRKNTVNAPVWEVVLPAFTATQTTSKFIDKDAPATAIYEIELLLTP